MEWWRSKGNVSFFPGECFGHVWLHCVFICVCRCGVVFGLRVSSVYIVSPGWQTRTFSLASLHTHMPFLFWCPSVLPFSVFLPTRKDYVGYVMIYTTLQMCHTIHTAIYIFIYIYSLIFFVHPLKVHATKIFKLQKVHKNTLRVIHMNWAVWSKSSEETQSLYMMNIFNLGFYSHISINNTYIEHIKYAKQKLNHTCGTHKNNPQWSSIIYHIISALCMCVDQWSYGFVEK